MIVPQGTTPVVFQRSVLIAAGGQLDALTPWQYETPRVPGMIELLERCTAVGLVSQLTSEGDTIKQRNNVQAGGTAGVTPSTLNTQPVNGKVQAGRKLQLLYDNPTGGGITIDFVVTFVPIGGGNGGGARRARGAVRRFARRRR